MFLLFLSRGHFQVPFAVNFFRDGAYPPQKKNNNNQPTAVDRKPPPKKIPPASSFANDKLLPRQCPFHLGGALKASMTTDFSEGSKIYVFFFTAVISISPKTIIRRRGAKIITTNHGLKKWIRLRIFLRVFFFWIYMHLPNRAPGFAVSWQLKVFRLGFHVENAIFLSGDWHPSKKVTTHP